MALNRWPLPSASKFWGWRGITWDVTRKPAFATTGQTSPAGRRARIVNRARSLDEWTLTWWGRDDMSVVANAARTFPATEARTLFSFFRQQRGAGIPFHWIDPTDAKVTAQVLSASTPAVAADPLNPDSCNYQVLRALGATGIVEPIDFVNEGTDGVAAPVFLINATPVAATPNSPQDGWVRLAAAPAAGSVLTWTGGYYQRVTFAEDEADFHTFAYNFWELRQLRLMQDRW